MGKLLKELLELKEQNQEKALDAWKNGDLVKPFGGSDGEIQSQLDAFNDSVHIVSSPIEESDPWVEKMLSNE